MDLCAFVMKVIEMWCLLRKSLDFVFKHSEFQHLSSFNLFACLCRQLKVAALTDNNGKELKALSLSLL